MNHCASTPLFSLLVTGRSNTPTHICKAMTEEYGQRFTVSTLLGLLGCVLVATMTALWSDIERGLIVTWVLLMVAVTIFSNVLGRYHGFSRPIQPGGELNRAKWLLCHHFLSGLAWGAGGWLLFDVHLEHEMALAMALCAVAAIGATTVGVLFVNALVFLSLIIWPSVYLLMTSDLKFFQVLSFAGIAYGGILIWVAKVTNKMGLKAFELGHENSELVAALKDSNLQLAHKNDALHYALAKVEEIATTDELTRCYNRRYMMESLKRELEMAKRNGDPFSFMLLDVDHFKRVNDTFGHVSGDRALATVAETLQANKRTGDTLARFGGEEFAIQLPGTTIESALLSAQRLRIAVEARPIEFADQHQYVTISIGITQWWPGEDVEMLIHRADQALYEAKRNGRNRVAVNPLSALTSVLSPSMMADQVHIIV